MILKGPWMANNLALALHETYNTRLCFMKTFCLSAVFMKYISYGSSLQLLRGAFKHLVLKSGQQTGIQINLTCIKD